MKYRNCILILTGIGFILTGSITKKNAVNYEIIYNMEKVERFRAFHGNTRKVIKMLSMLDHRFENPRLTKVWPKNFIWPA